MKILKNPSAVIYDTNDIDIMYLYPAPGYGDPIPLHHTHECTDYEYLVKFFPVGHPIFDNFSQSYFYKLPIVRGVFCWAVTGTFHGSIIEADTEGEARRIFHKIYNGESIIHIKKRNVPAWVY